jgi:hypothetical protein
MGLSVGSGCTDLSLDEESSDEVDSASEFEVAKLEENDSVAVGSEEDLSTEEISELTDDVSIGDDE